MEDHPISLLPQFVQEPPHVPLCDADILDRLLPRNQSFLGLFQGHQPVSIPLGHDENSWFLHAPSLILS
jgi:hypothetical protein